MASTILFGTIIFTLIWIISAVVIDKISQKRAKPYLRKTYRL